MLCPKCRNKAKRFKVRRTYQNGCVKTQERYCEDCRHRGTCILLVCTGTTSAYTLMQRVDQIREGLKKTLGGSIEFEPVFDVEEKLLLPEVKPTRKPEATPARKSEQK